MKLTGSSRWVVSPRTSKFRAARRALYNAYAKHTDAIDRAVWAELDIGHRVARLLERTTPDSPARKTLLPLLQNFWEMEDAS